MDETPVIDRQAGVSQGVICPAIAGGASCKRIRSAIHGLHCVLFGGRWRVVEKIGIPAGIYAAKGFYPFRLIGKAACVDRIGVTDFGEPPCAFPACFNGTLRFVGAEINQFIRVRFKIEQLRWKP